MENPTKNNTEFKKKAFIKAYKKAFGNVSQSCLAIGIDRSTYYDWIKKDEKFKKKIEEAEPQERFLDFLESKLVEQINGGNTTSIIFALKTKGKNRGYVERQEIVHDGRLETEVVQYRVNKKDDN
jgi:transposase-like protein